MPLTFLSHQAVVLPFKIRAPGVTSGTALVLGSIAPDVEYFLRGYPTSAVGHTWSGLITFCLPVTLALFWLVTRVIAEPVAAHLPAGGDLRLRDLGLIRHQPASLRHWIIVAVSALLGSASHVALDRVADGWSQVPYHALDASPVWIAVNVGLWIVLAAITLLLMRYIGRNRLMRRWAAERSGASNSTAGSRTPPDPPPETPRDDLDPPGNIGVFWGWVLLSMLAGAIVGIRYRRSGFFLDQGATWVHIWLVAVAGAFVGLVLASLAWHGARARLVQLRGGQR
jgi:hypothetical protein